MPRIRFTEEQIRIAAYRHLYRERHALAKLLTQFSVPERRPDGAFVGPLPYTWEPPSTYALMADRRDEEIRSLGLPPYDAAEWFRAEDDFKAETEAQFG